MQKIITMAKDILKTAKSFIDHPVKTVQPLLEQWYENCRKEAYDDAESWMRPPLATVNTVRSYAARLISWAAVIFYPELAHLLTTCFYIFDDLPRWEWDLTAVMIQFAIVLAVSAMVYGPIWAIFVLPIHTLRSEFATIKHLKSAAVTLGLLMMLSPVLRIIPVYTWHLPIFTDPYLRLSEVMMILGLLGLAIGALVMIACRMFYCLYGFIQFFRPQHNTSALIVIKEHNDSQEDNR